MDDFLEGGAGFLGCCAFLFFGAGFLMAGGGAFFGGAGFLVAVAIAFLRGVGFFAADVCFFWRAAFSDRAPAAAAAVSSESPPARSRRASCFACSCSLSFFLAATCTG